MEYSKLSMSEIIELTRGKRVSVEELTKYYIDRIKKFSDKNAVLEVFDDALDRARELDRLAETTNDLPAMFGVPVLLKDNIAYKGHRLSCASKFLEGYVSPYSATVTQKMLDAGAIILGRCNMDEFAMGSSTENSAFGVAKNAFCNNRVSGGSSGGSACAMALGLSAITLGSDTGGSIRQPASFNGVVGLKPTYGRVSRYGLVAFASSLDQIGPICKTVRDAAIFMNVVSGQDPHDQTSSDQPVPDYTALLGKDIRGKVFGVPKEVKSLLKTTKYEAKYNALFEYLKSQGATVKEVSIPHYELCLAVYYILAPAEAASNLGRFDGIKYSKRAEDAFKVDEIYTKSRTKFFGKEVKRRIMLGNFVLSSGFFDAYYMKAKRIKNELAAEANSAFSGCDALLMPTTFDEAFEIGSKGKDPISMYAEDMFTIFANLTGIASVSVPFDKGENGLPIGLQILSKQFDEQNLLSIADFVETHYSRAHIDIDEIFSKQKEAK